MLSMTGKIGRKDVSPQREICECGLLIKGISEKHLKFQMQTHKRGKKHKELMKFKEEFKK